MPTRPDELLDDEFTSRLIELAGAMAGETPMPAADPTVKDPLASQLRSARACLERLDRFRRYVHESGTADDSAVTFDDTLFDPDELPERIGRFEIVRELGRGGYGVVFLARDPQLDRDVALKVPRPEVMLTPELRQRFLREAKAAAALNHANVVPVFEVGSAGPIGYLATAYCHGPSLAGWLANHPERIAPRAGAQLMVTLAEAVQHAHSRGVIHRDLKPGNILLESCQPHGNGPSTGPSAADPLERLSPLITDFGLAKIQDVASNETRTTAILGTPAYMAPEQAAGRAKQVGASADIYALGAILYELLTGQPPFRKSTDLATLQAVQVEEPVPPRRLEPRVPRDLEAICLKCLEKEPAGRYGTATALTDDLNRYLAGEPVVAQPVGNLKRLARWAARNRLLAAVSAAAALLLVAVTVATTSGYVQVSRALEEAESQKAIANRALAGEQQQRQRAQQKAAEAARQRDRAEVNRRAARRAVDEYFTTISESTLLEKPTLIPLRQELLHHARDYYEQLVDQHGDTPEMRAELAVSYLKVGIIAQDLGDPNWLEPVRKTLDIFEQLLAEDVSLAELPILRDGIYHVRSSRLVVLEPDQALSITLRAIEIWEDLVDQHPDVAGFRSDLGGLYLVRGLIHYLQRESDDAVDSFQRSLELRQFLVDAYPDEPKYRYFLAESCACLGMELSRGQRPADALPVSRKAAQLFEESLQHYPGSARIEFNLALVYGHAALALAQSNQPLPALVEGRKSLQILERLARDYPRSADYQVALAVAYAKLAEGLANTGVKGPADQVAQQARDHIKLVLTTPLETSQFTTLLNQGYLILGDFMRHDKSPDAAERLYEKVLDIQRRHPIPDDQLVWSAIRRLAAIAYGHEDREQAEQKLQELLDVRRSFAEKPDKQYAELLYQRGRVLKELARLDEANAAMQQALAIRRDVQGETHPDVAWALYRLGEINQDQGRLDAADKHYREALAIADISPGKHHAMIKRVRARLEQLERSLQDPTKVSIDPDDAQALWRRARTHVTEKRWDEAIADCTRSIELQPELHHAYYWRATTWMEKGEYAKAIADFEESLALLARDVYCCHHLAFLYAIGPDGVRKPERSVQLAQQAVSMGRARMQPQLTHFLATLGLAHMRRGEYEQALDCLEESARVPAAVPQTVNLFIKAICEYHLDQIEAARSSYAEAVERLPAAGSEHRAVFLPTLRREVQQLLESTASVPDTSP